MQHSHVITHFGIGKAKVAQVASKRRYLRNDGTVSYGRMSRMTNAELRKPTAAAGTLYSSTSSQKLRGWLV